MQQTRETALLTVNEIAGVLRLSPSAVYRAIEAGEIRALRVDVEARSVATRSSVGARADPRRREAEVMRAAAMRATPHAADVEGGADSVSSRSRPDVEDVRIAYHEAAHAVAHYVLREGSSIRVVTIEPSARWSGVCLTSGNRSRLDATMDDLVCPLPLMNARVRRTLECDAIASLVGQLAEDYAFPKSRRGTTPAEDRAEETVAMLTGHEQRRLKAAKRKRRRTPTDTENAERQAWLLAGNDLMPAQLALLRAIARELVLSPRFRRLVEALVPALLEHRTLGGRRVVAIVKAADSTGGA